MDDIQIIKIFEGIQNLFEIVDDLLFFQRFISIVS